MRVNAQDVRIIGVQRYAREAERFPASETASLKNVVRETGYDSGSTSGFRLRLGKLGIEYSGQDSNIDLDVIVQEARKRYAREQERAYNTEMEIASLREQVVGSAAEEPLSPSMATVPLHKGLQAYARIAQSVDSAAIRPGTLISIA